MGADNLVLIAESWKLLLDKIEIWKEGMVRKGFKVNVGNTKIMKRHVTVNMKAISG